MADRYDPRRERGDWETRGPEWDRQREWEEGAPPAGEDVYGPYGGVSRIRQGVGMRSPIPPYRRRPSYTAGMGAYAPRGSYAGRGPRGWQRSDERMLEDVNERLTDHPDIDATDIEVQVKNGEVTLTGFVESREVKRMAEDVAESVSGVRDIHNQLRIRQYREDREEQPRGSQPNQATGTTGRKEPGGVTDR
jgi:hypothetical protein